MNDFWSIVSVVIIVSPFVIGIGAFAGAWLSKHFYSDPFYDDYDA